LIIKTPNKFYRALDKSFSCAMLHRARLCDSKSSVCLSVCDVEVWFSHRLEYLENNFTA